jgi:hypothetical protein
LRWLAGWPTNKLPFFVRCPPAIIKGNFTKDTTRLLWWTGFFFSRRSVALLLLRLLFALFVLVSNIGPEGFLVNIPDYYYNYYYYYTMLL